MYRLFNKPLINIGNIATPNMARLRDIVYTHVDYYSLFFKEYGSPISSNHIFLKLLYILAGYMQVSPTNYEKIIIEKIPEICSVLKFTSTTTKGALRTNACYTTHCAILSTTFSHSTLDWRLLSPIRCLTHPFTTLEIYLPPVGKKIISTDFSAIGIDILMLAKQFNAWLLENDKRNPIERESLHQYVSKYILPNMIKSHMDIAFRNRLLSLSSNTPIPITTKERSFVQAYTRAIDGELIKLLDKINTKKSTYYTNNLEQIPFLYTNNFMETLPYEINELSTNSYWLIILIYSEWAIIGLSIVPLDSKSKKDISIILKRVERFIIGAGIMDKIPEVVSDYYTTRIQKIKSLLN